MRIELYNSACLMRSAFLTLVLSFACAGIGYAQTNHTLEAKPAYLSDQRLESVITVDAVGIPLKSFLQDCSSKEVRLESSQSCAELKIQAKLKRRSQKTVMTAVAELFQDE